MERLLAVTMGPRGLAAAASAGTRYASVATRHVGGHVVPTMPPSFRVPPDRVRYSYSLQPRGRAGRDGRSSISGISTPEYRLEE